MVERVSVRGIAMTDLADRPLKVMFPVLPVSAAGAKSLQKPSKSLGAGSAQFIGSGCSMLLSQCSLANRKLRSNFKECSVRHVLSVSRSQTKAIHAMTTE